MPHNQDSDDLREVATRMIIGAGESVALLFRRIELYEFGLRIDELANLVDSRLRLRCLLPMPGIYRDRNGSVREDRKVEEHELQALKDSLRVLQETGWEVRLIPDRPLASSFIVDHEAVVFYEFLNKNVGPYYSEDPRQVAHYLDQFEVNWANSFDISCAETLYDASLFIIHPVESRQVASISHKAWSNIIHRLAREPELLRDLDPRKFEELVAELLSLEGLEVHLTPETRDGGRDLLAFQETPVGRLLYLVECKRHRPTRPVGIAIVQRLYGVVAQERASAGLVVTTSRFSRDALTFAETVKHQLGLKDYEDVKLWLKRYGKSGK